MSLSHLVVFDCILTCWNTLPRGKQTSRYQQGSSHSFRAGGWIMNQLLQQPRCDSSHMIFDVPRDAAVRPGLVQKPWWSAAHYVPPILHAKITPYAGAKWCTLVQDGSQCGVLHNPHPDFPSKRNTWLVSDGPLPTAWVRRGAGPRGKTGSEPTDSTATPSDIYFLFSPIFSSELISCCHTSSNSCQDSKKACSEQQWCKYPSQGAATCIALAGYPAAAQRTAGTHAAAKHKRDPFLHSVFLGFAAGMSPRLTQLHLGEQHWGIKSKSGL